MTSWVTTRLTLTGPLDEIPALQSRCIRVQPFGGSIDEEFDFEALIPIPPEIVATHDDCSDTARNLAHEVTGYPNGREWALANWGTIWNATGLRIMCSGKDLLDIVFDTPWCCPQLVFEVLAAQYPNVKGCVFAVEKGNGWGLAGKIIGGNFTGAKMELNREVQLFTGYFIEIWSLSVLSARAITRNWLDQEEPVTSSEDARRFAAVAAANFKSSIPCGWGYAVDFRADYLGFVNTEDDYRADEGVVLNPSNLAFFKANDRCRTEIDRTLKHSVANWLCEATPNQKNSTVIQLAWHSAVEVQLMFVEEEELYAWAALAFYRPNATLDMLNIETIKMGFAEYAIELREQVSTHLSRQAYNVATGGLAA